MEKLPERRGLSENGTFGCAVRSAGGAWTGGECVRVTNTTVAPMRERAVPCALVEGSSGGIGGIQGASIVEFNAYVGWVGDRHVGE